MGNLGDSVQSTVYPPFFKINQAVGAEAEIIVASGSVPSTTTIIGAGCVGTSKLAAISFRLPMAPAIEPSLLGQASRN